MLRDNWSDAEPLLLAELDRRIEQPLEERDSALFFYAIFLCAEMSCDTVYERYIRILRLPNLLLDFLLGDEHQFSRIFSVQEKIITFLSDLTDGIEWQVPQYFSSIHLQYWNFQFA